MSTAILALGQPQERTAPLLQRRPGIRELIADVPERINKFLASAAAVVRERFGGMVTYESVSFEGVDWTPFDVVSVDAHRSKEVAHVYQQGIRTLVAQGKPVAITEFGCTTHRGAADHGARGGGDMVEFDGSTPVRPTATMCATSRSRPRTYANCSTSSSQRESMPPSRAPS